MFLCFGSFQLVFMVQFLVLLHPFFMVIAYFSLTFHSTNVQYCLFVCLFGFYVAFNIICHITTVSGCDRELNAHFYSAASLWYQIPDTLPDTTSSHIILTPDRTRYLPISERTLYLICYRGRSNVQYCLENGRHVWKNYTSTGFVVRRFVLRQMGKPS